MQAGKGDEGAEQWSSKADDPDPSSRPGKRKAEEKRRCRRPCPKPLGAAPFSDGPGDRLVDSSWPPPPGSPLLTTVSALLMPRRPRGGVEMEKAAGGTVNSISFDLQKKKRGTCPSSVVAYYWLDGEGCVIRVTESQLFADGVAEAASAPVT